MSSLVQDLRLALRVLGRSPGFALAAIVTLGLGIGANTTMFGFMDALLLRPFDLPELDRLVTLWERHPQQAGAAWTPATADRNRLANADLLDLRSEGEIFASVAGYTDHRYVVTGNSEPERVMGYRTTPGFFETLGVRPALGRAFHEDEGIAGRDAVVLLSDGFWRRHFAADPDIIGRSILLDGRESTIIGVLPATANFPPGRPEIFGPLVMSDSAATDRRTLAVLGIARLRTDDRLETPQAKLDAFARDLSARYPDTNAGREMVIVPLRETQVGATTPFLVLFEGAALFVLLIACANVAGLVLGRWAGRRREMAVRTALGASPGRLVRQLMTEGLLLSLGGATVALYLAQSALDLVRSSAPEDFARWVPGWADIGLDGRSFLFTLGVALVSTLAFGLLEALRSARVDIGPALKDSGRTGTQHRRMRSLLVAGQVTLALVLLAGAGLMTRGFLAMAEPYQGFDTDRVVTMRLDLPDRLYQSDRQRADFYAGVLSGLAGAPGIDEAGVVSQVPADLGPIPRRSFDIEGRLTIRPEERPAADYQTISTGTLAAFGIAMQSGRDLSDSDASGTPRVVLISESLARRDFPEEDPVGRRIRIGDDATWHTIVGVTADVKQYWFDPLPRPTLYVSYLQSPRARLHLVIRSPLDTAAAVAAARVSVRAVDPLQPIDEIRTMASVVSESAAFIRLAAILMVTLGLVALVLAAVGLYAVIAESAARRTREIGIRMALGARVRDVILLVLMQAGRLTALGILLGMAGAIALERLMSSSLYGVVRPDPWGLLGVTLVLAGVAMIAAWIPARRAARVDPVTALRED